MFMYKGESLTPLDLDTEKKIFSGNIGKHRLIIFETVPVK